MGTDQGYVLDGPRQQGPRLAVIGEIAGVYSYTSVPEDAAAFVHQARDEGVGRLIVAHYHAPSSVYPSYVRTAAGSVKAAPYPDGPANPLAVLESKARTAGIDVVPFVNVATGGQWIRADYLSSGEVWPYQRMIGAAPDILDRTWSRTSDGRSWLQHGPRSPLGAYGYQSLAYPEVRAREQRLYVEWVERYRIREVMLEFMLAPAPTYLSLPSRRVACCDESNVWAYGYDEPILREFAEDTGLDLTQLPSDDPVSLSARARPQTLHLTEVRAKLQAAAPGARISVFVFDGLLQSPRVGMSMGTDWDSWLKESLVDAIYVRVPGDQRMPFRERFTADSIRAMSRHFRDVLARLGPRVEVWAVMELPTFPLSMVDRPSAEEARSVIERWGDSMVEAGAERVAIWHADALNLYDAWPAVGKLSRRLGFS